MPTSLLHDYISVHIRKKPKAEALRVAGICQRVKRHFFSITLVLRPVERGTGHLSLLAVTKPDASGVSAAVTASEK